MKYSKAVIFLLKNRTNLFYNAHLKCHNYFMSKNLFPVIIISIFCLIGCNSNLISDNDLIFVKGNENISDFYMSRYEVTQAVYKKVMKENPSIHKGKSFPVEHESFYDLLYFCNKLSEMCDLEPCYYVNGTTDVTQWNYVPHSDNAITDYKNITCNFEADGFRAPTWQEWEYAARGGINQSPYMYSGSDNVDEVSWYAGNSDSTQKVGLKKPNALGIYDLSGNVWEWCWDSFTGSTDARYYKGGSYRDITYYSRIENRARTFSAKGTYEAMGIRLVRTAGDK